MIVKEDLRVENKEIARSKMIHEIKYFKIHRDSIELDPDEMNFLIIGIDVLKELLRDGSVKCKDGSSGKRNYLKVMEQIEVKLERVIEQTDD